MPQVSRRWRKQPKFSLGGSKQQLIRGGCGSGLALATNSFHSLSPYHDDSSADDDEILPSIGKGKTRLVDNKKMESYACPFEDLRREIDECDIRQVIPGKGIIKEKGTVCYAKIPGKGIIKEEGTLCSANKLDLLTSEEVDENAREYADNELLCVPSYLERNISHDYGSLSRMNHKGVNLIYVKKPNFELDCPKNGCYDYLLLEEPHPWSCVYLVDVDYTELETQSPSISCNLGKDQQDSESICIGADIEHSLEVASEGIEIHINNNNENLDLDKEIMNLGGSITEEADIYCDQLTLKRSPAKFWVGREFLGYIVSKPEEIDKLNRNLALHRIKAYELSKGIHLDDKKLKDYNPYTFKERNYFVDYEEHFEWVFHPQYCNRDGLDDYQRLVPKEKHFEYLDWNNYHEMRSDYASDKEYLEYCKEILKQLQWLKRYLHLHPRSHEWLIVDDKALTQVLKIATGYPHIIPNLVWNAYKEYLWSLRVYSKEHDALHDLYFEVWKQFAKEKKSFKVALKEVHDHNMFPLCSDRLHHELSTRHKRERVLENQFNTLLAGIHKTAPDDEVHEKIDKAVQNLIEKIKFYEQYAEKKIAIAKSIGLIS